VVPRQTNPGAPVTVTLNASVSGSIEVPYDFAWRVDAELRLRPEHTSTITVTKTPSPPAGPVTATSGPQKLTTVRLTVIDMLGRASTTEFDAMYYPAAIPQQEKKAKAVATGGTGGAGGFIAALLIAAVVSRSCNHLQHKNNQFSPSQTLTIYTWDPDATVRDSTGRICAHFCHWQITPGTRVTLTATDPGPIPMNWVGCANSTSRPTDPCTLTVYQNSWICLAPYDPYQHGLVTFDRCRREAGG